MSDTLLRILEPEILVLGGGTLIAIAAVVASATARIVRSVSRERTRREIAAYIAEGSMTPEQGERLMAAGERPRPP